MFNYMFSIEIIVYLKILKALLKQTYENQVTLKFAAIIMWNSEMQSGSVVECLTRDRRAAGSSLIGVTALWSLSKTHLS